MDEVLFGIDNNATFKAISAASAERYLNQIRETHNKARLSAFNCKFTMSAKTLFSKQCPRMKSFQLKNQNNENYANLQKVPSEVQ